MNVRYALVELLADADLIGPPQRIVVSTRTRKEGKVEVKARTGEPQLIYIYELESLYPQYSSRV